MPLHLVKMCVGIDSVATLGARIERNLADKRSRGLVPEQIHTTRMRPKREAELLDGGSLYWVIKGAVQARQGLVALRPIVDHDGIGRCQIVLDPVIVPTETQPRRPFQGWRYLTAADAPADLAATGQAAGLPMELARELKELGLL
jgi:hypothetical protein